MTEGEKQPAGSLTIDSDPYATIYVDGRKLGYTPIVRHQLSPGTHSVRAVSSADGRVKKMSVTVKPGKHLRRRVKW